MKINRNWCADPMSVKLRAVIVGKPPASLRLSGDSPRGRSQGRSRYMLLTRSGSYQGEDPI